MSAATGAIRGAGARSAPRCTPLAALLIALALAGAPTVATAQDTGEATLDRIWRRSLELSGSLFIGNRPQTLLTSRARASRADSTLEFGTDLRFTYGEISRDGEREVSKRSWLGTVNLDLWPFASQSPFLLGAAESSFERRIQLRVSGGVGHKLTFIRSEQALVDLSGAILAEQSRLPTVEEGIVTEELARLSWRMRLRRRVDRVEFAHTTFYRPELARPQQYTFTNGSSVSFRMTERLDFKVSYLDNYDSEARGRGARSNYDGQVVVGVRAEF